MPTVRDVLATLDIVAPRRYALSFDKVGLQVGDLGSPVQRAVVALDRSLGAVRYAAEIKAELLLTHHPLIFEPISSVDKSTHVGRTILALISQGTSFIAAHTNWDAARGGVNDTLAAALSLEGISDFGMGSQQPQYKLTFTCPAESVEAAIDAASAAGAGVIGAYSRCAFSAPGTGTFIGGPESNPAVGLAGRQESVPELRVEMHVNETVVKSVVRAVRKAHPYEEPAIDLYDLAPGNEQPLGRVGALPQVASLEGFAATVDRVLETKSWTWGDPAERIRRVAIMGGAADSAWMDAQRAGADVLLTGEVKQHVALEASESGMTIIAAGHYATEHPGAEALRNSMASQMPEVDWQLFTPPPGMYGRPW